MVGNVCLSQDPSFLTKTMGKRGNFRTYAQEVKDEVSDGISMDDLLLVLRRAADTAKAEALAQLSKLNFSDPDAEMKNTKIWCDTSATDIIKEFILNQDEDHEGFE